MAKNRNKPAPVAAPPGETTTLGSIVIKPAAAEVPLHRVEEFLAPAPDSCGSCRYWLPSDVEDGLGLCRRNPPAVLDTTALTKLGPRAKFMVTPASEWCGEHRRV